MPCTAHVDCWPVTGLMFAALLLANPSARGQWVLGPRVTFPLHHREPLHAHVEHRQGPVQVRCVSESGLRPRHGSAGARSSFGAGWAVTLSAHTTTPGLPNAARGECSPTTYVAVYSTISKLLRSSTISNQPLRKYDSCAPERAAVR